MADQEAKLVDLLLRKSQVVTGVATQEILSLKSQEVRGRAWAKRNDYTVRQVWRENLSAYRAGVKRPNFDAAVHALLEGETDCLWAYDSSRYSRKGAGDVLKVLDSPGKRLVFDLNRLDTEIPEDRVRIINDAENDREYSRKLSQKVKDTKSTQRDQGKWLGTAPDGLKRTKKGKLKAGKRWPYIERIHEEAAAGRSYAKIVEGLNLDEIPSYRGGPWREATVGKILRNPVYLGWQTVSVRGRPQLYLNPKGKKVRVFAKGFDGIPEEVWKKHRGIAAARSSAPGLIAAVEAASRIDGEELIRHPLAGIMWCHGGGIDPKKGHRASSKGKSFKCVKASSGLVCAKPCNATRVGVLKVVLAAWKAKLAAADPTDPTMLAISEGWIELSQPDETAAEVDARAQLKIAEEAVARLDRLNAVGAYPGRDGEFTFAKLRRAALEDVEAAREEWENVAQPLGDISVLTDPEHCAELWESSSDNYRGQLIRLAIERIFIKKAAYTGQRVTPDRVVIVWKTPRGWKLPQNQDQ
ncbi:hypothetical protein GCM10009639_48120 [Kitasatospora putterlickiae]|uniref:Resolvase/invertase-type recombinase catalytic domain-containing protein n=1 Tax=Kitasatospora putterlickiae TaxID=221725 RepID=A0ABP4J529_9ACTN